MAQIKNIIFDLGGVIINLDVPRTITAFENLGVPEFGKTYNQLTQTPLFDLFDKGLISETGFFNGLKGQFHLTQEIGELEVAWNAMLLDFPKHRLEQLLAYRQNYNIFLLSNTNATHIREFEKTLYNAHAVPDLSPFFDKVYYSCRINLRKPDTEIFEFVLGDNGLQPAETVFIDDTVMHVQAAQKLGIHAFHLAKGAEFKNLLDAILDI